MGGRGRERLSTLDERVAATFARTAVLDVGAWQWRLA